MNTLRFCGRWGALPVLVLLAGLISIGSPAGAADVPRFQLPFFCGESWRASTYDGHFPDQNSIDLLRVDGTSAEGVPVVASASGTVSFVGEVTSPEGDNYGEEVRIAHVGGWETRYLHIETSLTVGALVSRGQRLGVIGKYWDMAPHVHYTQLLNGTTARITFNGTAIAVHKGAPKDAAGNYPTQNLTSANCAAGCTVQRAPVGHAANATCEQGAGMRAVVDCRIPAKPEVPVTTHYGPRVAAGQTSTARCFGGQVLAGMGY
ncbi:peptidoglycan DD-metalloendopeptidase family protein, partial [Saccharothrix sp. Mg75]|uniref:peptidoglycan DD-metalloendopeptidase family protein n=1 Tax=Saccharothrix sp. Mg75 TaxID=3445357 RepID=UPI003EEE5764